MTSWIFKADTASFGKILQIESESPSQFAFLNEQLGCRDSKKPENHLFWPYSESVSDSVSDSDSLLGSDSVSGSDYVSDTFSDLVKYSGSDSISDYVTYFFQIL